MQFILNSRLLKGPQDVVEDHQSWCFPLDFFSAALSIYSYEKFFQPTTDCKVVNYMWPLQEYQLECKVASKHANILLSLEKEKKGNAKGARNILAGVIEFSFYEKE